MVAESQERNVMRSKLGTKSRLAAHILALILLILMLVYLPPNAPMPGELKPMRPTIHTRQPEAVTPVKTPPVSSPEAPGVVQETRVADPAPLAKHAPPGTVDTLDKVRTPVVAKRISSSQLRPPGAEGVVASPIEPVPGISSNPVVHAETLQEASVVKPVAESLRPRSTESPFVAEKSTDDSAPIEVESEEGSEDGLDAVAEKYSVEEDNDPENHLEHSEEDTDALHRFPAESADGELASLAPRGDEERHEEPVSQTEHADSGDDGSALVTSPGDLHVATQPDESGSLVVASSETGLTDPIAAVTPIANANLEVLGDGIFWLDPRHDLETELSAVPDIGTLVLLTPLPGFQVTGFEHVKTETIPADAADIVHDSAEHFLHVLSDANRPIVVAPLAGARGAAFFKGAYLLSHRNLSKDEVMREIEPELDQAGEAREEIIHRLLRLAEMDRL